MNNPTRTADYTTRTSFMRDYQRRNRELINERKRRWREKRKIMLEHEAIEDARTKARLDAIYDREERGGDE